MYPNGLSLVSSPPLWGKRHTLARVPRNSNSDASLAARSAILISASKFLLAGACCANTPFVATLAQMASAMPTLTTYDFMTPPRTIDEHFRMYIGIVAATTRSGPSKAPQLRSTSIEFGREIGVEGAVDEHEQDIARGVRAVAPGVIGPALDQHVARLQQHLGVVEHAVDFAREDDDVIDRLRAMHQRMAPVLAECRGLLVAERSEELL